MKGERDDALWLTLPGVTPQEAAVLGAIDHVPEIDFTWEQLLAAYRAGREDGQRMAAQAIDRDAHDVSFLPWRPGPIEVYDRCARIARGEPPDQS